MMKTIQRLVSQDRYNIKCPYPMIPKGICVHNTSNDASAANEIAYMIGNGNATSFHYAIDDKEVIQGVLENRNAFHAGDGANGEGNRKYIGIEICYSKSGGDRFVQAEKNAAVFIASRLKEYDWDITHVKKHQDFSGKYCPHRTIDMGWQRFLDMIQAELDKLNEEEEPMTAAEKKYVEALEERIENLEKHNKVYHYWSELPKWAHDPLMALYKAGLFAGESASDLNISYDFMRMMVVYARGRKADGKIDF